MSHFPLTWGGNCAIGVPDQRGPTPFVGHSTSPSQSSKGGEMQKLFLLMSPNCISRALQRHSACMGTHALVETSTYVHINEPQQHRTSVYMCLYMRVCI